MTSVYDLRDRLVKPDRWRAARSDLASRGTSARHTHVRKGPSPNVPDFAFAKSTTTNQSGVLKIGIVPADFNIPGIAKTLSTTFALTKYLVVKPEIVGKDYLGNRKKEIIP